jgi:hypothetical protein
MQHDPREPEPRPAAPSEQEQSGSEEPLMVAHDRFLEALIRAVDEAEATEKAPAVEPTSSALPPSPAPVRQARARYSFD